MGQKANQKKILEKINRLYEEDEHQRIVDFIESLPKEDFTYDVRGKLACALNNLDREREALEIMEPMLRENPDDWLLHYRMGYSYYYLDEDEKAEKSFRRAVELNPKDPDSWYFLAKIYADHFKNEDASEYAKSRIKEISPQEYEKFFGEETPSAIIYEEDEIKAVEAHIERYFGEYQNVFHEVISPDIHVDIAVIDPTPERNFYTLVTVGMGAWHMNIPEDFDKRILSRAEMMICLPPDWNLQSPEEKDFWPLRWLKIMARMPLNDDTWLGAGHSVPKGEGFAENTDLSGIVLDNPVLFEEGAGECMLPNGEQVNFYMLVPVYEEEMEYKLKYGAQALFDQMSKDDYVVHIHRMKVCPSKDTMLH